MFLEVCDEIKEYQLQYLWSRIQSGIIFTAVNGDKIKIINSGVWNKEEGPDFKNAVLERDGIRITGDVELHLTSNAWFQHGHENDKNYSNVILHVVKKYIETKRKSQISGILTLELSNGIIPEFSVIGKDKYPRGFCVDLFNSIDDEKIKNLFVCAGIERLKEKAKKATDIILTYGVDKAFLMGMFDALGYKKNREQFANLLKRLFEYDVDKLSKDEINAVLWGESGFLPDPSTFNCDDESMFNFINSTWSIWWRLRKNVNQDIKWNLSGLRPQNNPCRRIAAGQILIERFGIKNCFSKMLNLFIDSMNYNSFWKEYKRFLICNDKIWDNYSSFLKTLSVDNAVLGTMRALDILVNVILPLMYGYGLINNDKVLISNVINVYTGLPKGQDNIIIEMSSERWLIPKERIKKVSKSSAAQQGIIFIYRNYCELLSMNCANCCIFKNISTCKNCI